MPKLDKEALREQTEKNAKLLKSEEFLEQLNAVLNSPEGSRLDEAARRLTPKALREAGVNLPSNLRVSSRYFEPNLKRPIELGDIPGQKVNPITTLEEFSPGILGRLRERDPEILERLGESRVGGPDDLGSLAACGGVGVGIVCACFGS